MEIVQDADIVSAQDDTKNEASLDASTAENAMIAAPTPTYIPSSPPPAPASISLAMNPGSPPGAKSDSEAETVLLPGVDGYSPSKSRKVKLEDRNDDNGILSNINEKLDEKYSKVDAHHGGEAVPTSLGKRKRTKHTGNGNGTRDPQRNSSGLSSVPTSPIATTRSSPSKPADSDSDVSKSPSPRPEKKVRSLARRSPTAEHEHLTSRDDKEQRINRKQHIHEGVPSSSKHSRVSQSTSNIDYSARDHTRSTSPGSHTNRRSVSTQPTGALTSSLSKKKRIPAPLRATKEKNSRDNESDDESSTGESPHPRRSRTRNLGTPPTGDSSASLAAKMGKRKRVQYGLSPLAVACEHGELKKAKEELEEHPEDLDSPDNAGNTPLQVAALNGHANICKFLISKNCDVHCQNLMKESPLLDAAENGHLDVVRVLLAAGVNPRVRNVEGEEALDRIDDEAEDAEAIRQAITEARANYKPPALANTRISSSTPNKADISGFKNPTISHSRSRKTNNNQLYLAMDIPTLRMKAAIGDDDSVYKILEVLGTKAADPEALVNAAKGGHENVVSFMLALTGASPDPEPVRNKDRDHATPILAAIGGDNIKVIEVLLGGVEDGRFNPTRRHDGKTYQEIARERRGPHWQEEEKQLKQAIDKYEKINPNASSRRDQGSSRSSARRDAESNEQANGGKTRHQRSSSGSSNGLKREKIATITDSTPARRGPGRPRRDPSPTSDPETTHKQNPALHIADNDGGSTVSDSERSKPRRKLISGKDLKGERQRRESVASVKSSVSAFESTDVEEQSKGEMTKSRFLSSSGESRALDKPLDRARSLKRDDSKDRLSAIRGESPSKRQRTSPTPPVDTERTQATRSTENAKSHKRRRLEGDSTTSNRAETGSSSSPERRIPSGKDRRGLNRDDSPDSKRSIKRKMPSSNDNKDVNLRDISGKLTTDLNPQSQLFEKSSPSPRPSPTEHDQDPEVHAFRAKLEAERLEEEARVKREAENLEKFQLEEAKKLEEARLAEEAEAQQLKEEAIQREKDEILKRERDEAAAREREEAERLEAERREKEKREEAERKVQEEIERKRVFNEQQRLRREDQERRKAEHEAFQRAEQLRIFQEQETARLAKLPALLQWLDACQQPAKPEHAELFNTLFGVRYDTIIRDAQAGPESREQWVLNTQVALLLGEKDLQLSRYTAWERLPADDLAKQTLFNVLGDHYSMITPELRRSLHGSHTRLMGNEIQEARTQTYPLWMALDTFFVKVSELMFIIPKFPHLRNLDIFVLYKELPSITGTSSSESPLFMQGSAKWRTDPDAHPVLAPGKKTYVNGHLSHERKPQDVYRELPTSTKPFPSPGRRLPLLEGIKPIQPGHPLFEQLCRDQGLEHLLNIDERHGPLLNGALTNGMTPPDSIASIEDSRRFSAGSSESTHHGVNGVNGIIG